MSAELPAVEATPEQGVPPGQVESANAKPVADTDEHAGAKVEGHDESQSTCSAEVAKTQSKVQKPAPPQRSQTLRQPNAARKAPGAKLPKGNATKSNAKTTASKDTTVPKSEMPSDSSTIQSPSPAPLDAPDQAVADQNDNGTPAGTISTGNNSSPTPAVNGDTSAEASFSTGNNVREHEVGEAARNLTSSDGVSAPPSNPANVAADNVAKASDVALCGSGSAIVAEKPAQAGPASPDAIAQSEEPTTDVPPVAAVAEDSHTHAESHSATVTIAEANVQASSAVETREVAPEAHQDTPSNNEAEISDHPQPEQTITATENNAMQHTGSAGEQIAYVPTIQVQTDAAGPTRDANHSPANSVPPPVSPSTTALSSTQPRSIIHTRPMGPRRDWGSKPSEEELRKLEARHKYDKITHFLRLDPQSPVSIATSSGVDPGLLLKKFHFEDQDLQHIEKSKEELRRLAAIKEEEIARRHRLKEQEEKRRMEEQQRSEKEEEERKLLLAEYERLKAERRQSRKERMAQRERERQAEQERMRAARNLVAHHFQETPLHIKLERNFEDTIVAREDRERMEKLKELKLKNGPMNHDAIREFEQQFLRQTQEWEQKRKEAERQQGRPAVGELFHGSSYLLIQDERERRLEEEQKVKEELKMKTQKREHYANLVHEMFRPRIDERKQLELQSRIHKMEEHRLRAKQTKDPHKIDYMREVAAQLRQQRGGSPSSPAATRISSPVEPERKKPVDYLQQLKAERAANPAPVRRAPDPGKLKELHDRTVRLEKEIVRKEDRMSEDDLETATGVSEMYLDVIQAKLNLLQQVK